MSSLAYPNTPKSHPWYVARGTALITGVDRVLSSINTNATKKMSAKGVAGRNMMAVRSWRQIWWEKKNIRYCRDGSWLSYSFINECGGGGGIVEDDMRHRSAPPFWEISIIDLVRLQVPWGCAPVCRSGRRILNAVIGKKRHPSVGQCSKLVVNVKKWESSGSSAQF